MSNSTTQDKQTLDQLQGGDFFYCETHACTALVVRDENGECAAEAARTGLVPVVIVSGERCGQLEAWPKSVAVVAE